MRYGYTSGYDSVTEMRNLWTAQEIKKINKNKYSQCWQLYKEATREEMSVLDAEVTRIRTTNTCNLFWLKYTGLTCEVGTRNKIDI